MACDTLWDKTVLACHFDGTNGSTTFVDEKGHTLTAAGSAQISTTQSKFGGSSAKLDGAANRVTSPDSSDYYLGNTDFTVEAWVYPTVSDVDTRAVVSQSNNLGDNANRQFAFLITSTTFAWYWTTNGSTDVQQSFSSGVPTNTWTHIAVVRSGNTLYGFKDGVLISSVEHTAVYFNSTADLCIGTFGKYAEDGYPHLSFNGYIDDLRITKAARWTANFTPPAASFLNNQCVISGTIKNAAGDFAAKTVRAFRRDTAALVGSGVSNATTGAYSLAVEHQGECFVVSHDDSNNPPTGGTENAVILDRVVPA